jgi:hypothetical protein
MRVGSQIAQVNQNYDENVKITSDRGKYKNLTDAQQQAAKVSASDSEDAVIVQNDNGEYQVYGTSEIGTLDAAGNNVGEYELHDFEAKVVSFDISKRDTSGNRLGGEVRATASGSSAKVQFSANKTENGIVQVGRNTRDFMDYFNPINSGGDSVQISIKGEAGVSWGWGGVDVSGGATITASKGDEGDFLVNVSASAGVQGSVGKTTPTGGAKVGAGVGAQAGVTYRFKSAQEASDFLVHNLKQNMPGATTLFPMLANVPDMSHVKPATRVAASGNVAAEASMKLGNIEVGGAASFTYERSRTTFPPKGNAAPIVSHDWSATGAVSVGIGNSDVGVQLNASVNRYHVDKHPIPENTGDYIAANGDITFKFTESQLKAFSTGQQDAVLNSIIKAGSGLGLTGTGLKKFEDAMLDTIQGSIDKNSFGKGSGSSVSITVGVQAQWEMQSPDASGKRPESRLQYLRVGLGASTTASMGFDAGIAHAKLTAGVSSMDYRNVVTGDTDKTYLQGLYFENRAEYNKYKADLGGGSAIVEGKSLAQWEAAWRAPGFDRTK